MRYSRKYNLMSLFTVKSISFRTMMLDNNWVDEISVWATKLSLMLSEVYLIKIRNFLWILDSLFVVSEILCRLYLYRVSQIKISTCIFCFIQAFSNLRRTSNYIIINILVDTRLWIQILTLTFQMTSYVVCYIVWYINNPNLPIQNTNHQACWNVKKYCPVHHYSSNVQYFWNKCINVTTI